MSLDTPSRARNNGELLLTPEAVHESGARLRRGVTLPSGPADPLGAADAAPPGGPAEGSRNGHRPPGANGAPTAIANGHAPPGRNGSSSGGLLVAALSPSESSEGAFLGGGGVDTWRGRSFEAPAPAPAATPAVNGHHPEAAAWALQVTPRTDGAYLRFGKRLADVAGAVTGIVLFGPLMAVFAALVKLTSRGPVLYRSIRLGKDGRPFTFYKFRSMYAGADRDRDGLQHLNECDGPAFKISRDPRTTALGRFMRSTSIDELPQFFNVLRGEMSLVGPRPPLPDEEAKYEPWQRRRLEVKPGLTCLWQISGRSRLGFDEWMRLDLEYIKRQSFATDLRILLRTIPAVLSRDGAY
jgi:lipopolysaccharide/colanic/teichoic acid biosynthesis glycosyltransferase